MLEVPSPQGSSAAGKRQFQPLPAPRGDRAHLIPLIAIAGETNSGKTTLVNFLLQAQLLAVDIIPNTTCPTLLRFGNTAHLQVHLIDGTTALRSIADLHRVGRERVQFIEVFLPSSILRRMEILDLPGLSTLADAEAQSPWVGMADIYIWCTAATQAWKASEQAMWKSLARPRRAGLLALTHKDLLTHEQLSAVAERISRETGAFFSHWTAIATPEAIAARNPRGEIVSNIAWRSTGVEDFIGKLKELLRDVIARRDDAASQPEDAAAQAEDDLPQGENAVPQMRLTSRAATLSTASLSASAAIAHPVSSFSEVRRRIIDSTHPGQAHREVAAIMMREFESYTTLILKPWLASKGNPAAFGTVEKLIPGSEAKLLEYLMSPDRETISFPAASILKQLESELTEFFIADRR